MKKTDKIIQVLPVHIDIVKYVPNHEASKGGLTIWALNGPTPTIQANLPRTQIAVKNKHKIQHCRKGGMMCYKIHCRPRQVEPAYIECGAVAIQVIKLGSVHIS